MKILYAYRGVRYCCITKTSKEAAKTVEVSDTVNENVLHETK
jgi:hypothetical protein